MFARAVTSRTYVTDLPPDAIPPTKKHSVDHMWGLWNEGNLFSLAIPELTSFLHSQRVTVDPAWKKAALVRQVEEFLQAKEDSAKQPQQGRQQDSYGAWNRAEPAGAKQEVLLDLGQAGFYEGSTQNAPRAFQLLVADSAPDLVVSRVNTTSFPGYPANAECYTLTAADAAQSTRARYSKTLQWCCMNLRNLGLDGEVCVEFGKLLLKPEISKKNRHVVSSWTLQQRMQVADPYHWVTATSETSVASLEELLAADGFTVKHATKVQYDVHVHRANDTLLVELSAKGATTSVHRSWDNVQQTLLVAGDGVDSRFVLRSRTAAKKQDIDAYTQAKLIDVQAEEVQSLLPPELGKVVYATENDVRKWEKVIPKVCTLTVTETRRQPLLISRDEDDGERIEFAVTLTVPSAASGGATDMAAVAEELYRLAERITGASKQGFLAEFGTQAEGPRFAEE
jgi:hypothetical protein